MRTGTLLTFEELERLPDDAHKYELLEGELLVSPPPNFPHQEISHNIFRLLIRYERGHGKAYIETGSRLGPNSWVQPDVSFITNQQGNSLDSGDYLVGAPQLSVEVISKTNTPKKVEQKIRLLLDHGAEEIWVVYPKTRTIVVHRAGQTAPTSHTDTPTTPIFSDLRLDVRALFE